jgi:MFS family permease
MHSRLSRTRKCISIRKTAFESGDVSHKKAQKTQKNLNVSCGFCAFLWLCIFMALELDRSYRALLRIPSIGRLLIGMQAARIGQSMVSVAIVLFALTAYHTPRIAGFATFFSIFPGLVVSPIAGALLDRHGRIRLVVLDYLVALAALVLMGSLSLAGALPAWLLIAIAAVGSLTNPLSGSGVRSIFPLVVPVHLWERVNAVDSTGFVFAAIVGPPLAAGLVAFFGGPVALIIIGSTFALAAIVLSGCKEPPATTAAPDRLIIEAWRGLVYTWRNPTLRGLGFSISVLNIGVGVVNIVLPVLILQHLGLTEMVVGLVFAVQGLAGIASAVAFGGVDSRNRERIMLALPMVAMSIAVTMLLFRSTLSTMVIVTTVLGLGQGPLDIALFTVRQRRTDPVWTGRAFAVSMSINFLGYPIGSLMAGIMVARSLEATLTFGALTCLAAAGLVMRMIPVNEVRS